MGEQAHTTGAAARAELVLELVADACVPSSLAFGHLPPRGACRAQMHRAHVRARRL